MRALRRLRWWIADRRALVTMIDDAHAALRQLQENQRRAMRSMARSEYQLQIVTTCPGRVEHIRLAHRAEQAEAERDQALGVDPHQHSLGGDR